MNIATNETNPSPPSPFGTQLRYLNEMLAQIGERLGIEPEEMSQSRDAQATMQQVMCERAAAQERLEYARVALAAAEAQLAHAAGEEAETETRIRAEVRDLLHDIASRPHIRKEYVRSLEAIFEEGTSKTLRTVSVAGATTPSVPAPANEARPAGFWSKLFTLEKPRGDDDFALFALTAADSPASPDMAATSPREKPQPGPDANAGRNDSSLSIDGHMA